MKLSSLFFSAYMSVTFGDPTPNYSNITTTSNVCVGLLDNPANATGVQNGSIYSSRNALGRWRIAVSTDSKEASIEEGRELSKISPGAVANVWLDPFTNVELTNGRNDYSACAYIFKSLPYNTMLRGQDDDTSCEQMLSKECIAAITSRAAETARWLVQSPTQGPFSNLTPPILEPICEDTLNGIGYGSSDSANPFPSECTPFFENTVISSYPRADSFILTSNVSTPQNCTFEDNFVNGPLITTSFNTPSGLRYPYNSTNESAVASYDELVDHVWPILTILFAPANNSRESYISYPEATMTCIRAGSNIKPGSRVPAALPAAAPVHFPSHLSKGAIAGIVIGTLLGIAIIAGAIWWFWRKYRKQSTSTAEHDVSEKDLSPVSKDKDSPYQLDGKGAPAQLESEGTPAQLHSSQRAELKGSDAANELQASAIAPQELYGSPPVSSISKGDNSAPGLDSRLNKIAPTRKLDNGHRTPQLRRHASF